MGIRESGGGGRGSYAEKPEERTLQPLALIWKEEIPLLIQVPDNLHCKIQCMSISGLKSWVLHICNVCL